MTFTPIINHDDARVGIHAFDVGNSHGVWLGIVRVRQKHAEFNPASVWLTADQLIAIARFMKGKTDGTH